MTVIESLLFIQNNFSSVCLKQVFARMTWNFWFIECVVFNSHKKILEMEEVVTDVFVLKLNSPANAHRHSSARDCTLLPPGLHGTVSVKIWQIHNSINGRSTAGGSIGPFVVLSPAPICTPQVDLSSCFRISRRHNPWEVRRPQFRQI